MGLRQARVIRFQRGYLSANEGKLAANCVAWCAAIYNHPVQFVNVFVNCMHNHIKLNSIFREPSTATKSENGNNRIGMQYAKGALKEFASQ
jgi:hypothetical protein